MKTKKTITSIIAVAALIVCATLIITLMNGETKTTGQNPSSINGAALICKSTAITYPITTYDNSINKDLKVIINSYSDKVDAISLTYELFYDNSQQVAASEARNHADMNISFGKDKLSADAFNAHYSKMENSMKMTLYAKAGEITSVGAKYFLIDAHSDEDLPNTLQEYQNNYKMQGFSCTTNNN